MSVIPEVKCRRCGATFSSLRSRCPNCGTRRVAQSGRTPGTTPGTVRGTASYERAETNTKWQMIFGLILVVAVILAVIVMVSTSLNGTDASLSARVTPSPLTSAVPTIEAPPTLAPTPTPTVEKVEIRYGDRVLTSLPETASSVTVGQPLKVTASVYPIGINTGAVITWSSEDESVLTVTATSEDGTTAEITCLDTKAGGVKIYAECFGVKGECLLYCQPAQ